jgi:hypothetical protein
MYGRFSLDVKEPKDPPLITNFLEKAKKSKSMKLSISDERRERALSLAKKKFMSNSLEDRLMEGKSKEFLKNKRLLNKRKLK